MFLYTLSYPCLHMCNTISHAITLIAFLSWYQKTITTSWPSLLPNTTLAAALHPTLPPLPHFHHVVVLSTPSAHSEAKLAAARVQEKAAQHGKEDGAATKDRADLVAKAVATAKATADARASVLVAAEALKNEQAAAGALECAIVVALKPTQPSSPPSASRPLRFWGLHHRQSPLVGCQHLEHPMARPSHSRPPLHQLPPPARFCPHPRALHPRQSRPLQHCRCLHPCMAVHGQSRPSSGAPRTFLSFQTVRNDLLLEELTMVKRPLAWLLMPSLPPLYRRSSPTPPSPLLSRNSHNNNLAATPTPPVVVIATTTAMVAMAVVAKEAHLGRQSTTHGSARSPCAGGFLGRKPNDARGRRFLS
jgi:hypothetical protein